MASQSCEPQTPGVSANMMMTPTPDVLKHSTEIKNNMGQISRFSPDFLLKKKNNYDNTVKYLPRNIFK